MEVSEFTVALRMLTDVLGQGVLVLDSQERLVHANPAAMRRLRIGDRMLNGQAVRPWLSGALGLSAHALDLLAAGETVAAAPHIEDELGGLELSRVVLPGGAQSWTAIVLHDRRADARSIRVSGQPAALAPSHRALWAALLGAIDRGYEQGVALGVLTVEITAPVEATALCRLLAEQARPHDAFGFLDAATAPVGLAVGSIWAAIASPGCSGAMAHQRRDALSGQIARGGWPASVGAAVLRLDRATAGAFDAEDRARAVIRAAIRSAKPVRAAVPRLVADVLAA